MKLSLALIASTYAKKNYCPLNEVPSDYECVKGPAGRWECSRDCPFGAGKRRMNCECTKMNGCKWNDFEGWCIKDEITTSTSTTTSTTTRTTTGTTTSTTTSTTTTTATTTTTTDAKEETTETQQAEVQTVAEITAEEATTIKTVIDEEETTLKQETTSEKPETRKSATLVSTTEIEELTTSKTETEFEPQATLDKKPVHFTFEIFDLNSACPTDIAPDGNSWTCYSEFEADGDTTICNRTCKDGSGQEEINVCTCTGFNCHWEMQAECQYQEKIEQEEFNFAPRGRPIASQTTTTQRPTIESSIAMLMDAVGNFEPTEALETVNDHEEEMSDLTGYVEAESEAKRISAEELDAEEVDYVTIDGVNFYPKAETKAEADMQAEIFGVEEESDKIIELNLNDATKEDLDAQTSGNPFSAFLQSLQKFAKMTLVSIDEGFVQPVRYQLGITENPK